MHSIWWNTQEEIWVECCIIHEQLWVIVNWSSSVKREERCRRLMLLHIHSKNGKKKEKNSCVARKIYYLVEGNTLWKELTAAESESKRECRESMNKYNSETISTFIRNATHGRQWHSSCTLLRTNTQRKREKTKSDMSERGTTTTDEQLQCIVYELSLRVCVVLFLCNGSRCLL